VPVSRTGEGSSTVDVPRFALSMFFAADGHAWEIERKGVCLSRLVDVHSLLILATLAYDPAEPI